MNEIEYAKTFEGIAHVESGILDAKTYASVLAVNPIILLKFIDNTAATTSLP